MKPIFIQESLNSTYTFFLRMHRCEDKTQFTFQSHKVKKHPIYCFDFLNCSSGNAFPNVENFLQPKISINAKAGKESLTFQLKVNYIRHLKIESPVFVFHHPKLCSFLLLYGGLHLFSTSAQILSNHYFSWSINFLTNFRPLCSEM
jgi:hypothetical protein